MFRPLVLLAFFLAVLTTLFYYPIPSPDQWNIEIHQPDTQQKHKLKNQIEDKTEEATKIIALQF